MGLTLRDAWRGGVAAEDYESHMAAIGQAEANAKHLAGFAGRVAGRILIAGAGPGQFFDYLEPGALEIGLAVFTDINPLFLTALRRRCPGAICVADDLESTSLLGGFDGACATLVLEHTEWRAVVRNLIRLTPLVMIVIQVNPPEMATAVSPGRTPPGSMRAFKEVHPHLIDEAELGEEFRRHGAQLIHRHDRPVADGKTMRALTFQRA